MPVDASSTRQIALDLLLNACAASPERGQVSFSAVVSEGSLVVSVLDEGPGIPEAALAVIRAGAAGESAPAGKGLGLWTASRLASRLGGQLDVRSGTGSGAIAEFRVPLREEVLRAVA